MQDQVTKLHEKIETIQKTVDDLIKAITNAQQHVLPTTKMVDRLVDDKPTADEDPAPGMTTMEKHLPTLNIVSPTRNTLTSMTSNTVKKRTRGDLDTKKDKCRGSRQ